MHFTDYTLHLTDSEMHFTDTLCAQRIFAQNPVLCSSQTIAVHSVHSFDEPLTWRINVSERLYQHIGDDQLVYGMPKHMSATATGNPSAGRATSGGQMKTYWRYHPKP